MARRMDSEIIKLTIKHGEGTFPIRMFKRFLDDIVMLWCGTVDSLHSFIKEINTIIPSIQFTLSHTFLVTDLEDTTNPCKCERTTSISFLDTSLSISNGKVEVDLYRKPTDRNQYLLTSSCILHMSPRTSPSPWPLG